MNRLFLLKRKLLAIAICTVSLCACGEHDASNEPICPPPVEPPAYFSTDFMRGSTMCFAQYLLDSGLKYRENGVEKNPYASLKEHGGNVVRLQLNFEDFPRYNGVTIDWPSWKRVLADAKSAYANNLDIVLTIKPDADAYNDRTADHNLVPTAWKSLNENEMGDALYQWVYESLKHLADEGIYPRAVAVGNEVTVGFLQPSAAASADAARTARLLKRGFQAVHDYAANYNPHVRAIVHIDNPSLIEWFVGRLRSAGCTDFHIVATSWYPGSKIGHEMGKGSYASFGGICAALKQLGYDFMILETAHSFTTGTVDGKWLGDYCDNTYNYPDWADDATNRQNYTPAKQRAWLRDLANELKTAGGVGLVTWGTESLPDLPTGQAEGHGLGLYTYPAPWGYGSTWDNNSYWDFTNENNLHEGIDWMRDVQ